MDGGKLVARYWLSFDLGLRGNYEGLYEWLDNLNAKECGDSVATFVSDKNTEIIRKELSRIVDEKSRIYLISRITAKGQTHTVGKFIIGRRKAAPWVGYGASSSAESDEEE
jgi:hypothetical protein